MNHQVMQTAVEVTETMLRIDILGYILRCYYASQAIIDKLVWMKLVSKQWQIVVSAMFLDEKWLHPFIQSGNVFIGDIPEHVAIIFNWDNSTIDQVSLHEYLQQMRMHTRHEAAQFHGIKKLYEMISHIPMPKFNVIDPDVQLLFNIVNNALNTHSKVLRVQKIGIQLQCILLLYKPDSRAVCIEYGRAVDGVVKTMQVFGDDISEKDFIHTCTRILFNFSTDYISRMLSFGVERVLFKQMLMHSGDFDLQTSCMAALVWFYREASPSLDPHDVLHFLTAMFDALAQFQHEESFLQIVANIFKTLVFIEEYSSTLCCHLVEEGYMNIFADELKVYVSYNGPVDEMQMNENAYTNIMKMFRGILNHPHLCINMAMQSIKDVIQIGMSKYQTNTEVQYTTCRFFRLVFFPLSETRNIAPTPKILKLVLNAMENNPAERLMNVECVLSLDTLMNTRHITNYASEQQVFELIVHKLYEIISAFESTSSGQNYMSHNCQSEFVQASLSILSKLPSRSHRLQHYDTDCILNLTSSVTEVMLQYSNETKIQDAALHVLEKYIFANSEIDSSFHKDGISFHKNTGLLLMKNALKLPDLSSESRTIAQKILRLCADC